MKTKYDLIHAREVLSNTIDLYNDLLNELLTENAELDGWLKTKFDKRFKILDGLLNSIIAYDAAVQQYVAYHPESHNVQYYKDKLEIARRYITAKGLDWSNVTWGKISDYRF